MACFCQTIYLKSNLLFISIKSFLYLEKSICSEISNIFCLFKTLIKSSKFSTQITSIHGIIDASKTFSFGKNILLNQFCFAHITEGNTQETFLKVPSKANSQRKIESFKYSSKSISHLLCKIATAIAKSKLGQDFFIFAGAKFTIILDVGSFELLDFNADLNLSLLSWTHWSGSQTIVKAGSHWFISTSTSIIFDSSQFTAIEFILLIMLISLNICKILILNIYLIYSKYILFLYKSKFFYKKKMTNHLF